jgi:hydrogenase maturation protein HypF
VLIADYKSARRAAHLQYTPLPGGDTAIKRPYRLALAQLWAAGLEWDEVLPSVQACPPQERKILLRQLETGLNCINTSSIGRLFDAVASLAGVRQVVSYEAQAAIEFEALATPESAESYQFDLKESADGFTALTFGTTSLLLELIADIKAKVPPALIGLKLHNALAKLIVNLSSQLRATENINCVALSGGVFQNVKLLKLAVAGLRANDFEVITHRKVPPNDGGLALGQAMIGNHLSR